MVYFGGKVDIALTLLECPLMTQSGHRTAKTLQKDLAFNSLSN